MLAMKFIREHMFEILLSVIIALITYLGTQELNRINQVVCLSVANSTEVTYDNITTALSGLSSFDDLRDNARQIRDLQSISDSFRRELAACDKGQRILKETQMLVSGLHAYINHNYTQAAKDFGSLNLERSLPHYLLGATYGHASETQPPPPNAEELRSKAERQFGLALDMAREESGGSIKEAVLLTLKCKKQLIKKTLEANKSAIDCFNDLVIKKYDDYNTYYNLACLHSRQGEFDLTLDNFKIYLDRGGSTKDSRTQAEQDPDFIYIRKSNRAGEFDVLLNRYTR
jgi:hypothetical protein